MYQNRLIINNCEFYQISVYFQDLQNQYYINAYGDIYNTNINNLMKFKIDRDGYYNIQLCNKNHKPIYFRVHKLVNYIFNGKPPKNIVFPVTDHIDGNIHNNHYTNLRWLSRNDNNRHEYRHTGLLTRINQTDIIEIYNNFANGMKIKDIASKFNVSRNTISRILYKQSRIKTINNLNITSFQPKLGHKPLMIETILDICFDFLCLGKTSKQISNEKHVPITTIKGIKNGHSHKNLLRVCDFNNLKIANDINTTDIKCKNDLINSIYFYNKYTMDNNDGQNIKIGSTEYTI